jgi:glucosamine-6-phosphate deaminase
MTKKRQPAPEKVKQNIDIRDGPHDSPSDRRVDTTRLWRIVRCHADIPFSLPFLCPAMHIAIHPDRQTLGRTAAQQAADALLSTCGTSGRATLVVATGASQFEVLAALADMPGIPWHAITVFHLDEYVGLPDGHPASFRLYIRERFIERLPTPPAAFHPIDGNADPRQEVRRLAGLVPTGNFDVALIGIGENAHLAFNDPPADFDCRDPYLVVSLDEPCRRQQVGEGWFATLADVPTQAISMSVQRILASRTLICSVPDERKAAAVRAAVEGPLTQQVPASILRQHGDCRLHLDGGSAALLGSAEAGTASTRIQN